MALSIRKSLDKIETGDEYTKIFIKVRGSQSHRYTRN